jgi:hypothetical protein
MDAMAKTSERRKAQESVRDDVGRQAANQVWSPSELLEALKKPSRARKQEILREVGIIDASGKISKRYRSWGNRVSRTSFSGTSE